ncbi:dihydrolipoamide acetyltransferase family protein [Laceyella putida]|uniref:Dihydrolipoamide acetyltransferase component of pyruvate dehydrogenase complex n=1 Tax=Laceyella putida TaxID=110101 RepID=A0ABW2RPL0_9BACL
MSVAFRLPDIGEGVAEAEVVRWLVKQGEEVEENQPVIEVQTDKAVVELPAPASGKMAELKWKEGDVVPVGEILYVIGGEAGAEKEEANRSPQSAPLNPGPASPLLQKKKRVLAAPSTRRLARELRVDLTTVKGTGAHGRVTAEDVRAHALNHNKLLNEKTKLAQNRVVERDFHPGEGEWSETPLSPVRKVIAERLLFSVTTKPHATHFAELAVDGLVEWRQRRMAEQDGSSPRLSYLAIISKMVAQTLKHHPLFNAHFIEETQTIRQHHSVSLGIAADTPKGLLVPVLREVERKTMDQLAQELHSLTQLARAGKLTPEHLKGSTFTISNAGALGGTWATPIINPPEVAILALHPIEQKPIVQEGKLTVGWRMNISLSFDHRVMDGADAIRFAQTLETYTRDPGRLLKELV